MELHLRSHEWRRRLPDWPAAVCAGLVGGAVLMVLELLWSASVSGASPWHTSHLIAAMVMGTDTLQSDAFSLGIVSIALLTHYVLGIVFGVALAFIIDGFHYESSAGMQQVIGLVFAAALYLFNFFGMAAFFPWVAEMQGWATFIGHLVFGLTVALTYPVLERRRADR
ncbi:MAG TPA: hypothetical protein VJ743_09425 [Albitalea sp.]|nr:hypothetical protein [Albitalea sp.]